MMINYLLPQRAATVQTLGHPAAGVIGWLDTSTNVSGQSVTPDTALTFSAVWCAVRVISETLATLPCILYRRTSEDGRERATDDPRYSLLRDRPHPLMSAVSFFETMTAAMVLRGNCYAKIIRTQGGQVDRLELQLPDNVNTPVMDGEDNVLYRINDPPEVVSGDDMLHVAGLGGDGINGWSVVKYGAQSIGSAMAGDQYAAGQMGNGATPTGVLKFPTRLTKEARDAFRKDWNEQHQGAGKAGNIAILHGGMEYAAISMTNEDAQLLQSRQFSIRDIARWFRLPPHMLADLSDSSVRANIEQQAMEFITYSMAPWLTRWQQALNAKLLTEQERQEGMYFEFLLDSLLRGDVPSRFTAYATARQWGWLSVNDIRRRENMNTIEGGDVYLQPSNMVPADSDMAQGDRPEPAPQLLPEEPPEDEDEEDEEEPEEEPAESEAAVARNWEDERATFLDACDNLFRSHLHCCRRVEEAAVLKAVRIAAERGKNFVSWLDWYSEFEQLIVTRIGDVARCYSKVADPVSAQNIASEYCALHRGSLLGAADGDPAGFAERVRAVVDGWQQEIDELHLKDCSYVA